MKKVLIKGIVETVIGAAVAICSFAGLLDEFWCGLGICFTVMGALYTIKGIKYKTDENFRKEKDIEQKDERNKYISMKAWSFTGYIFVIMAGIAAIVFKILGMEDIMQVMTASICVMVLIYWISFMVLNKKY